MTEDEILPFLESHPFFKGLNAEQLDYLLDHVVIRHYKPDEIILRESDTSRDLYLILEGEVDILKLDEEKIREYKICSLTREALFGELSFIDGRPRSSTAKSKTDTVLLVLNYQAFHEPEPHMEEIMLILTSNISKINAGRLRSVTEDYVRSLRREIEHFKMRMQFGQFFIYLLICMGVGLIVSEYLTAYQAKIGTSPFDWAFLIVVAIPIAILAKVIHFTWKDAGVTLIGWKKAVGEGLLIGIVLAIPFLSIAKFVLRPELLAPIQKQVTPLFAMSYFFHAYVQELISRGVIQSALQRFYDDTSGVKSVVIVSIIFGAFHLHISVAAAATALLGSLLFGFIYLRHRNVLGVAIVHFILGLCAIYLGLI